jgi:hypothetical protein
MDNNPVIRTQDQKVALRRGRLIFALDATVSREATWAIARELQAKMFRETAPVGHLDAQLVYYRGAECRASKWVESGEVLAQLMNCIECVGGYTQIGRVLQHALRENDKARVEALVFIGDAMEEEIEELAGKASELGKKKVPIFIFQEGRDPKVQKAFRLLALKSGGQYFEFNPDRPRAIEQLSAQLNAVARMAAGDAKALEKLGGTAALTDQRN